MDANTFRGRPLEELKQLRATRTHEPEIWHLVDDEIRRQESEAAAQVASQRHSEVLSEQQRLRGLVDGVASAQTLLGRTVGGIHRIDVWILIVGVVAALAGIVAAAAAVVLLFHA